jgi:hypothetical protein
MKNLLFLSILLTIGYGQVIKTEKVRVDFNGQSGGFKMFYGEKFINTRYMSLQQGNTIYILGLDNNLLENNVVESYKHYDNGANIIFTNKLVENYMKITLNISNWKSNSLDNIILSFKLSGISAFNYPIKNKTIYTDDFIFDFEDSVIVDGINKNVSLTQHGNMYKVILPYINSDLYYDPIIYPIQEYKNSGTSKNILSIWNIVFILLIFINK